VTHWLDQLKAGDHAAAQELWERYFRRLVGLARKKLQDAPRRAADEEDVALSAFDSFCRGAAAGRFPQLLDRNNLWRLLVTITVNKVCNARRDARRQKRGGGAVRGESALRGAADPAETAEGLEQVVGREPTPELAAQLTEECRRRFQSLDDAELQAIALWKMEGHTTDEIAAKLACAPSTVERRLRLIRSIWEQEIVP
jgi:DNA-directed RNA polymerase specialized sigma24 family protein